MADELKFCSWQTEPYSKADMMLAEAMYRINGRCEHAVAERLEKSAALAWCRANGNPHVGGSNA